MHTKEGFDFLPSNAHPGQATSLIRRYLVDLLFLSEVLEKLLAKAREHYRYKRYRLGLIED